MWWEGNLSEIFLFRYLPAIHGIRRISAKAGIWTDTKRNACKSQRSSEDSTPFRLGSAQDEQVHVTSPSRMMPLALCLLHYWASILLRWKEKPLHQVLRRENQNVVRGRGWNPKPQASVTGAASQAAQRSHGRVVRVGWLCLHAKCSCPCQSAEPLLTRTLTFTSSFL